MKELNKQKEYGRFYSKNKELVEDHIDKVREEDILIDPFAGEKDLLNIFENEHIAFDLDESLEGIEIRDSLMDPPSYEGKFIITNPPYLAENKTGLHQSIYKKYDTNDLYKSALLSLIETGERGIIIIPSGFWFNERSQNIRERFLSKFIVENVTIFNKQMFKDTTYTVSSFYFERKDNNEQTIKFKFNGGTLTGLTINYGVSNGYSILKLVESNLRTIPKKYKIGRFTFTNVESYTNMYLNCLDTASKIKASYQEPYQGINTDRAFLTFTVKNIVFTEEVEKEIIEIFNNELTKLRDVFQDSFLSNFRNNGRKRIGFNFAYKLLAHSISICAESRGFEL